MSSPAAKNAKSYIVCGKEISTKVIWVLFFISGYGFGLIGGALAGLIAYGLYRGGYIQPVVESEDIIETEEHLTSASTSASLLDPLADEENILNGLNRKKEEYDHNE